MTEIGNDSLAQRPPGRADVWLALAIIVPTLFAYSPVFHAGFIWDDDDHIYENDNLDSRQGLVNIWLSPLSSPQYYPLTHTVFWFEHQLWGDHPAGYHIVSVLFHVAGALLLWRNLRLLNVPGAWMAAAIFALHPVHSESVAWISETKNTLSGALFLGSALTFLKFTLGGVRAEKDGQPRRPWSLYAASMFLFLAAILSKTVTATLPASLLLILWWKKGRISRGDVILVAPMFLVGVPMGLFTAWLEKHHVMAQGADWSLTLLERCLIAGRALWFYAGKLAFPFPLSFNYTRWQIDDSLPWQYGFPVLAILVIGWLWRMRHRWTIGPLVGVLRFCGTLFPALGFFNLYPMQYSFVADHFQYLASIGLIVVSTTAVAQCVQKWFSRTDARKVGIVVLLSLGIFTWLRCPVYQDAETLWGDTLRKNPDSWLANNNLGVLYNERGDYAAAIPLLSRAVELDPVDVRSRFNLGNAFLSTQRPQEALSQFETLVALDPNDARAHVRLGYTFMQLNNNQRARDQFNQAIQIDPDYAEAYNNLGSLSEQEGDASGAIREFRKAISLSPEFYIAHFNLGVLFKKSGDLSRAVDSFQHVIEINGEYTPAYYELGTVLVELGEYDEAIICFERLIEIDARIPQAYLALGALYKEKGETAKSNYYFESYQRFRRLN